MKNIKTWMENFSQGWKNYDIEKVMSLFTQDVDYWESPYEKFESFEDLKNAWKYIYSQKDIVFEYEIFSQENEKYTIEWKLEYFGKNNEKNVWSGVYLLKLNEENVCYYFKQIGEELKLSK